MNPAPALNSTFNNDSNEIDLCAHMQSLCRLKHIPAQKEHHDNAHYIHSIQLWFGIRYIKMVLCNAICDPLKVTWIQNIEIIENPTRGMNNCYKHLLDESSSHLCEWMRVLYMIHVLYSCVVVIIMNLVLN